MWFETHQFNMLLFPGKNQYPRKYWAGKMQLGANTVEEMWEAVMCPEVHEHLAAGREHRGKKHFYILES